MNGFKYTYTNRKDFILSRSRIRDNTKLRQEVMVFAKKNYKKILQYEKIFKGEEKKKILDSIINHNFNHEIYHSQSIISALVSLANESYVITCLNFLEDIQTKYNFLYKFNLKNCYHSPETLQKMYGITKTNLEKPLFDGREVYIKGKYYALDFTEFTETVHELLR